MPRQSGCPPHCSLGMSQRIELWTLYLPVEYIVASNAILQELRIGKQCYPARIAGCLLDGSAPKPLNTRAGALWLWGMSASYPYAAFAKIKKLPLAPVVGM